MYANILGRQMLDTSRLVGKESKFVGSHLLITKGEKPIPDKYAADY
jgi:hypothetical protein